MNPFLRTREKTAATDVSDEEDLNVKRQISIVSREQTNVIALELHGAHLVVLTLKAIIATTKLTLLI